MQIRQMASLYWRPILITVLSIAVLVRGWCVSDPSGAPVDRAGALVTTLGLLFAFWQYGHALADRERFVTEALQRQLTAMGFPADIKPAESIRTQIRFVTRRRERIIASWEGSIIMIGTLTWGFGDIIYQYWQRHLLWSEIVRNLWYFGAQ